MARQEIELGTRPLERALFDGAIDNVGGDVLGWLTRTVDYGGNIASVGLAGGAELKTTVIPFILRAVNLLGINSVTTPRELRLAVWQRIASNLRPRHLDRIVTREIGFDELPSAFSAYVKGEVTGRTVVKIGG
jgi:acrylyl-CoA reductase (NADPH)